MALKVKFRTLFPALVTAASPLTLVKTGLAYAFGLDINALVSSIPVVTTTASGLAPTLPNDATKFLNGVGAYATPAGSSNGTAPCWRLSLTSGVALPTADVTNGTSVYCVPAGGGQSIAVYNGTSDVALSFTAQVTLALDSTNTDTNYHQSGNHFDVFAYNSGSSVLGIGTGPAWSTNTAGSAARGTGAGTTEIEFFNGLWRNKNSITLRFGSATGNTVVVAARQATYLGSFYTTGDGQATDSVLKRLVYTAYNAQPRNAKVNGETLGSSWTYTNIAWRQVNANAANQVEILQGLTGHLVKTTAMCTASNTTASQRAWTGVGVNSTTVASPGIGSQVTSATTGILYQGVSQWSGNLPLGRSVVAWLEASQGGAWTFYSGDNSANLFASGLLVECVT